MPHLILEVSKGIAHVGDLDDLLERLVTSFSQFPSVDPPSVKARAQVYAYWTSGMGAPPNFVHLTVCVLDGRPSSLLGEMADALYQILRDSYHAEVSRNEVSLTLEVRQMNRETYRKADRIPPVL